MHGIADVGAAVIGTGFIGTVHVEALRRIGVQVRGVLGSIAGARRRPGRRARRRRRPIRRLDDAARRPDRRRSSTSPRPTTSTCRQAQAILAAGRHVVCEKPLAMTAAESAELVELAAETGLVNATNFNIRYYPLNQHARELDRGRRRSATSGSSPAATSRTGCSSRATGTGASSRTGAARCARSATSGRTGWT